jgi:hypothetical protein
MASKQSEYSEGSIRVLKGLEPVKQRPGMYTRTDNPLHIIQEVIDNAADEALAGFGKKIAVTLFADGSAVAFRLACTPKKKHRSLNWCSPGFMRAASSTKAVAGLTAFLGGYTAWV